MIEEVALLSALDDRLVERLQHSLRCVAALTLPPAILRQQELVDLAARRRPSSAIRRC